MLSLAFSERRPDRIWVLIHVELTVIGGNTDQSEVSPAHPMHNSGPSDKIEDVIAGRVRR